MPSQINEGSHGYESEHEKSPKHCGGGDSSGCVQVTGQEGPHASGYPEYGQQHW
jgi:hypothetical protein